MFNGLVRLEGNEIILMKDQTIMIASLIIAALILLFVITIALKSRKRSFIKTVPTNLKEVE